MRNKQVANFAKKRVKLRDQRHQYWLLQYPLIITMLPKFIVDSIKEDISGKLEDIKALHQVVSALLDKVYWFIVWVYV